MPRTRAQIPQRIAALVASAIANVQARSELEAYKRKRPRARLTIRQRNRVLKEWPRADVKR